MKRARVVTVVVGTAAGAYGCAAIIGLEGTTTETATPPDATSDDGDGGAGAPDTGVEPEGDAGVTPSDGDACASPIQAVRAEWIETARGAHCGVLGNVLVPDGQYVGLDYEPDASASTSFDGRFVHGCVGVQFDGGPFSSIVVRARSVEQACLHGCTPGSEAGCGTGMTFLSFLRADSGAMTFLASKGIVTREMTDQVINIASVGPSPFVVVCRGPWTATRNDVVVDAITACP